MLRIWGLAIGATALALALAGCGGDNGAATTKAQDDSPLSALFGDKSSIAADELKVQEKVRDCMVALGFQYTPLDPTAGNRIQTIDTASDDFVKQNGFGISTFADGFKFQGGDAAGSDPNSAYLSTLSESDKAAYRKALFGDVQAQSSTDGGPGGAVSIKIGGDDGNGNGCLSKANREVRGSRPVFNQDLQAKLQELNDRIQNDPRMLKAGRDWAACMAKAGYNYPDIDAARQDFRDRVKAITGKDPGAGIGGGSGGVAIVIGGGAISTAGTPVPTPTPAYDVSALHALQNEERKTALVALDCAKKNVIAVEKQVRKEYEEAFIKDNPGLVQGASGK